MQQQPTKLPFFKRAWFMWLMLIFVFPVGVVLLWLYGKFGKTPKIIISVLFGIIFLIVIIPKGGSTPTTSDITPGPTVSSSALLQQTASPAPTEAPTPAPTEAPTPTVEPTPSPTPEPTATPFDPSALQAVKLNGKGDDVVTVTPPDSWVYRCVMTHAGKGNFVVYPTINGDKTLAINEIGKYSGQFPMVFGSTDPATVEITANGKWTLSMEPLLLNGKMEQEGKGMYVSDVFNTDKAHIFSIKHTGKANFIVRFCSMNGEDLLVNEIGNYEGKKLVEMEAGSVGYWVIIADGTWSIKLAE